MSTTKWNEIPDANVYIICVSTLLKNNLPDLSPIFDVCEKISKKSNSSTLVSIESTVLPFTSRKVYKDIFKESVFFFYVPHRFWAGNPIKHGVKQLRLIGAINSESLKVGLRFYKKILKIPLWITSSIEVAEMSKIAENAYRYIQIAYAEELKMICNDIKLNFDEVREACNTKWNIEIPEARNGIGGHCLPKDIRYLSSLTSHNSLLKSAVIVDKKYREWLLHQTKLKDRD